MKITVDLNVLLDVAQNREPHYVPSEEVLNRARLAEYSAVLPGTRSQLCITSSKIFRNGCGE